MNRCAVLIPIYKRNLLDFEKVNIKISLSNLIGYDTFIVAPNNLDLKVFEIEFDNLRIKRFNDSHFSSVNSYSRFMLSNELFEEYNEYSHLLICQTDAIVLKPELHFWLQQPYDYIGAPWPDGYEIIIKTNNIPIQEGIKCRAFVGNGGLSLRKISSCLKLFEEFKDVRDEWIKNGHSEDLFFGFTGFLSTKFNLPNFMVAAHFSHETQPEYMFRLIGNKLPFGAHGFDKYPNIRINEYIEKYKKNLKI
jgi:hypothetical protein